MSHDLMVEFGAKMAESSVRTVLRGLRKMIVESPDWGRDEIIAAIDDFQSRPMADELLRLMQTLPRS